MHIDVSLTVDSYWRLHEANDKCMKRGDARPDSDIDVLILVKEDYLSYRGKGKS